MGYFLAFTTALPFKLLVKERLFLEYTQTLFEGYNYFTSGAYNPSLRRVGQFGLILGRIGSGGVFLYAPPSLGKPPVGLLQTLNEGDFNSLLI